MSRRERVMLIVLGIVAVGAGGFFLLTSLGGGDAEERAAPTVPASPPPIPAAPGTGVGEPEPQEPPRAITFFGGRDPFVPLVVEPEETVTTGETGEVGGEVTPDGEVAPAGEVPPSEEAEPVPGDAEEEQPGITVTGRQVTLVDIVNSSSVQVGVDGQTLTVEEGEEFAENFELVSVAGACARFLFGDESFSLCQWEAPK